MTRNHNLYLNICILHTDVYSQHHFINFHFQKTTKLVKMFKKIRSVSKIKKKTDKKVNIKPSIENWPKNFYRIFDQTVWEFCNVFSKLFSKIFENFRILMLKISQNETTVLFTLHATRLDFLVHFITGQGRSTLATLSTFKLLFPCSKSLI